MARFEKSFPAMEARARQRKFNLDRGLATADDAADAEGVFVRVSFASLHFTSHVMTRASLYASL